MSCTGNKTRKNLFKRIHHLMYWIIPTVVLIVIFKNVNIEQLKCNLALADLGMVLLGLACFPLAIMIGVMRWFYLLKRYYPVNSDEGKSTDDIDVKLKCINFGFVLKHYWIGLAIGFVAPASVGWDIYRIVVAGRRLKQYGVSIVIIIVEKLMALFTCMSLIIIIFPLFHLDSTPQTQVVMRTAIILLVLTALLIGFANFILHNKLFSSAIERIERFLGKAYLKFAKRVGVNSLSDQRTSIHTLLQPLINWRILLPLILFSYGLQASSALGNYFFFRAVGYDLPFLVHMFVMPILFFLFILPLSFGGVGVREGAHIFFYGLFDVPAEAALLVAFFGFTGVLLNLAIGGIFTIFGKIERT